MVYIRLKGFQLVQSESGVLSPLYETLCISSARLPWAESAIALIDDREERRGDEIYSGEICWAVQLLGARRARGLCWIQYNTNSIKVSHYALNLCQWETKIGRNLPYWLWHRGVKECDWWFQINPSELTSALLRSCKSQVEKICRQGGAQKSLHLNCN